MRTIEDILGLRGIKVLHDAKLLYINGVIYYDSKRTENNERLWCRTNIA